MRVCSRSAHAVPSISLRCFDGRDWVRVGPLMRRDREGRLRRSERKSRGTSSGPLATSGAGISDANASFLSPLWSKRLGKGGAAGAAYDPSGNLVVTGSIFGPFDPSLVPDDDGGVCPYPGGCRSEGFAKAQVASQGVRSQEGCVRARRPWSRRSSSRFRLRLPTDRWAEGGASMRPHARNGSTRSRAGPQKPDPRPASTSTE
jgi:hypothetical protein